MLVPHRCPKCDKLHEISSAVFRVICSCGNSVPVAVGIQAQICVGCKFRNNKGCALYIRPCFIRKLWAGEIEPPEHCPNKERFELLEA